MSTKTFATPILYYYLTPMTYFRNALQSFFFLLLLCTSTFSSSSLLAGSNSKDGNVNTLLWKTFGQVAIPFFTIG